MNLQIVSIQAALRGGPPIVWIGDVEHSELMTLNGQLDEPIERGTMDSITNAAIFRFFNRVDEADSDRLAEIGFNLPSLSVGDLISWGARTWRVSGAGFECITDSADYVMALTAYTLRTMNPDDDDQPSRAEIERGI